jgi:ZIP family zinc transporter
MPVLGGLLSLVVDFSQMLLTLYLGFFAGVLMYIAASNILPQAHDEKASYKNVWLTVFGVLAMLLITHYAIG